MRVISQKLRDSARGRECTLRLPYVCNHNPETTVLAHLPCGQKGVGMKGPDILAIFCCSACHDVLDGRAGAKRNPVIGKAMISKEDLLRALAETQLYWIEAGLLTVKGIKK